MEKHDEFRKFAVNLAKKAGSYLLENFMKDRSLFSRRGLPKEITILFHPLFHVFKDKIPIILSVKRKIHIKFVWPAGFIAIINPTGLFFSWTA
jgi:hypothetical protein